MQSLSLQVMGILAGAIDRISEQRMPDTRHMYANLVCAPGFQAAFDICGAVQPFQNLIMGDCFLAMLPVDGHFFTIGRMTPDWPLDSSDILFQIAAHHGPVTASNAVLFELGGNLLVRLIIFADKQRSRCVHVDSVYDAGAQDSVDAG